MNKNINWSEKVKSLDKTIREELGVFTNQDVKNILIKIQLKSSESIEPALIIDEDEQFLDLFVLSNTGNGIASTTVLKESIQSIGVLGTISKDIGDVLGLPDESPFNGDNLSLYQ